MKHERFWIGVAAILLAAFFLGVTGMVTLADAAAEEAAEDRLVGVFVTTEYLDLFDSEAYFHEHADELLRGGTMDAREIDAYQRRLYAARIENRVTGEDGSERVSWEYKFTDVEGIAYFYTQTKDEAGSYSSLYGDEAISGGKNAIDVSDAGSRVTLDGIVYTVIGSALPTLYFNPVYQAADGAIYAVSGSGMSFSSDGDEAEGETFSQTLSAEYKKAQNEVTTADSIAVKVAIQRIYLPTGVRVVQFDENDAVLASKEYRPGELPETLSLEKAAAYLIVESQRRDLQGKTITSRTLYERGAESFDSLYDRGDGICIKQYSALVWGE